MKYYRFPHRKHGLGDKFQKIYREEGKKHYLPAETRWSRELIETKAISPGDTAAAVAVAARLWARR